MKYFGIFLLSMSISMANAQLVTPKHTFNVELLLPNGMGNKPFSSVFHGLVNCSPYYQYALPNSLAFGVGLKYTYFDLNEFKTPEPIYGGMHTAGAFVKISMEKFHSDRFGTDIGVKVGYSMNYMSTDLNKAKGHNPVTFDAGFVEPTIGLILSADEFTSYRLTIGYTIMGYGFKPYQLGTDLDGGWDHSEYSKPTHYLLIGFGFTYYFKSKE